MDKQQEQMKQNPNREVEYISGFLNEDEEVNESEFDESVGEQEASKFGDSQQKNSEGREKPEKSKRPRKTIEQEIAELDAKRERLMEKKRKQEAHEKIVFGATVITLLKELKKREDQKFHIICKEISDFTILEGGKNKKIVINIIEKL